MPRLGFMLTLHRFFPTPTTRGHLAMATDGLRRALGPVQYFSFAFGVIVGVGWIVLLGDWLREGGPLGAMLAFGTGGLLMCLIGLCYAEAATLFPVSGGEFAYTYEAFGVRAAYVMGWALVLLYIATVSYVCLSMAWILDVLLPGIRGPALYSFRGEAIHLGSLLVALAACAGFAVLNQRGVRTAGRFQDLFTYGKIAIAVVFILAGILAGRTQNLQPLFQTEGGRAPWRGVLAVMAIVPWFLGGFNTVPQVMEEKAPDTPLRTVGRVTVLAILAAAAFYCLVILSASMAIPWRELLTRELPAAAAFRAAANSRLLEHLVLLTGLFGVATVGNGTYVGGTRVLFAMSRAGLLDPGLAHTDPRTGTPDRAVILVGLAAALGVLLGRKGIGPIVAVGATCLSLGYLLTSAAVLRLRRVAPDLNRPYRLPFGRLTAAAASLGSLGLLVLSLAQPFAASGGLPLEWLALAGWTALGVVLWVTTRSLRASIPESARRGAILGAGSK